MGIANKYFGPIVLSMNYMMKDVFLFLITFIVIMVAFASGVSYIFNMASGKKPKENNRKNLDVQSTFSLWRMERSDKVAFY